MNRDPLVQMRLDFITDAADKVEKISRRLAAFDPERPIQRTEVDQIFRTAHSLKGTAGMFELDEVSKVAASVENVLELIRSKSLMMNSEVAGLLLDAFDEISVLFTGAEGDDVQEHAGSIIDRIDRFLTSITSDPDRGSISKTAPVSEVSADEAFSGPGRPEAASLPRRIEQGAPGEPDEGRGESKPGPESDESSPREARLSVKVEIGVLDSIMNTISELYSARVGLAGIAERLPSTDETRRLRDDLLKLSLLIKKRVSDLEQTITGVRLVPMSMLFDRYRREVRRLARSLGKSISLAFDGEATLVDRALLERLYDPLLHIIRNAVGHGIETPEERMAAGKEPKGTVLVRARQESNHIRVDVEDDGRGIDLDKIKALAEAGGTTLETDESATALLFKSGFSTKEGVDEVSGRGVGLDAVKTQVEAMRGTTAVDSHPGTGTVFSIWVPLTVAVSRGILVEEGEIPIIVPLGSVVEILPLRCGLHEELLEGGMVKYRGRNVRAISLSKALGLRSHLSPRYAVVTGIGDKQAAIVVRGVSGETEVVSRPVPRAVDVPCFISGAAELHNGRTAIVIQPEELSEPGAPARKGRMQTLCGSAVPPVDLMREWQHGKLLNLLVFRAGGRLFGTPLYLLKEIIQLREYARLPVLGDMWEGLFFVRGMCHGLARLEGVSGAADPAARKAVIFMVPERCGVGAVEIVGNMVIPYRKIKIFSDISGSHPLAPVGTFKLNDAKVDVIDLGGLLQRTLVQGENISADARHPRTAEPLMGTSSPDDK
jgi:two-component system chemotaxis sensor kinase CheA